MAEVSTLRKYKIILEEFEKRQDRTLNPYDENLINLLDLSSRQIGRLIKELSLEFNNIIKIEGKKQSTYKLIKPIDLFVEAFDKSEEIGWLFNMVQEADPTIFKALEEFTNENKNIFKFQTTPFEDISTFEEKDIFKKLKRAIQNREYIKLSYKHVEEVYDNLKCLKLLFIDNNWYLAFVDDNDKLRLTRLSFIKKVDYATKIDSFSSSSVDKQINFLNKKLQNAMTLYGEKTRIAKLKALPEIARYFEKNMKIFLTTQQYLSKQDDGSIIFTVEFTQALEILPFIQTWMPNIIILEPLDLKNQYINKLKSAINLQVQ